MSHQFKTQDSVFLRASRQVFCYRCFLRKVYRCSCPTEAGPGGYTLLQPRDNLNRRGIKLQEANPMSGVFQNIDPHPLNARVSVYPPPLWCGERTTRWVERGVGGGNIVEDARHCSVLYIPKYFLTLTIYSHTVIKKDQFLSRSVLGILPNLLRL
jgi:hypothetical protein